MSERYVNIDRETQMLLPPDLREWVEEEDLVHFVIAAVEQSDLSTAKVRTHGGGSRPYPPAMMIGLLIYSYAHGVFSSRQIERSTFHHVGVRYLCGNAHPDHDTICLFRVENRALIKAIFAQVLKMAGTLGLLRVGTISIDGTKILANAATRRTMSYGEIQALEERLQGEIEGLLEQAEKADKAAAPDGERLPRELASRRALQEKLAAARAVWGELVKERAQAREEDRALWAADPIGDAPRPLPSEPQAEDRVNVTDPQSRMMPLKGGGYGAAYNVQAAVTSEGCGLMVAAQVTQEPHDRQQLLPMAQAVKAAVPGVQTLVLDTGYDHPRQIQRAQKEWAVEIYCPPQKTPDGDGVSEPHQESRARTEARRRAQDLRAAMSAKTRSEEGRRLLRARSTSVEPAFGIIKSVLGWRRFSLRGLEKVSTEWDLIALAFNCRRLARHWTAN